MKKRLCFDEILQRLREPRKFIQVLIGPRQVGKTTIALELEKELFLPYTYISADTAMLEDLSWIKVQWEMARQKVVDKKRGALFVIDEIQKIPEWSSVIKKLWDEDSRNHVNLKVLLLGSSPWLMQKGLSESLAGRFEIFPVMHWSFPEMKELFKWNLDQFIFFGGYPGPALFANEKDFPRWLNYINDSLIETTLSRDILLMTQVNKPVLLRRLFQLSCSYSSQILSYQKMLGQLMDAGNTVTLAHYLTLLSGASLIGGIEKYSPQKVRTKGSSPKLQVYNTALIAAQAGKTFREAREDKEFWGRMTESAVGAHLINSIQGKSIELYYWREGNQEVDFVLKKGAVLVAIEVKSSWRKEKLSGLDAFDKLYHPTRLLVVGGHGISVEEFLSEPIDKWLSK